MSEQKNAIIIGASAGVGRAIAEALATKKFKLLLCARQERDLEATTKSLSLKFGSEVTNKTVDLASEDFNPASFVKSCIDELGQIDYVFFTAGMIHEKDDGLLSSEDTEKIIRTNYLSIVKLISGFINVFQQQQKAGKVIVFSSIAAAAPRGKNIAYASSKSALETYCRGLQHKLANGLVQIQVYALGYVDTSMSYGKRLLLPVASPEQVARYVIKNLDKNFRFRYYPRFWTIIIWMLKRMPWFIYKRLSF